MSHRRAPSRFGYCLLSIAAPLLVGATGLTSNFSERVLDAQNRERAAMGIAGLRWNPGLAASAQSWANHLAATGRFDHAPEAATNPEGENLWAGTRGYYSTEAMVDAWVREKRYFTPGVFPHNSVTGDISAVGHYTQLMWRTTGEVGCALATGQREDILVCRYSDAGNYSGEIPF